MTHSADADEAPRTIHNNADHTAALAEMDRLIADDPPLGTPEGEHLDRLAALVLAHEGRTLTEGDETADSSGATAITRQPGRLAGRTDDAFFDPLPEDELIRWEGGAD